MIEYEYVCDECGAVYEVFQKITEEKLTSFYCPVCDDIVPVERLVGSAGFVLSGDGWFNDGYTKEKEKNND